MNFTYYADYDQSKTFNLYPTMKLKSILVILGLCMVCSCSTQESTNTETELVVGGLYISQSDSGIYSVSKILAVEEMGVHVTLYSNEFETKPDDLNSSDLQSFIGHVPMAKKGFLLGNPELLKVEEVTEEELVGYRYYLEAMENQ